MNYYPFHIGDYASKTRHLSWEEDTAYRRLMDVYYTTEKPIPLDVRQACRLVMAQTEAQREAVRTVLQEFFEETENGWINARVERELVAMREKQNKQREKANKRWHKPEAEPGNAAASKTDAAASKTHAEAMPPTPTPTPTPTPVFPSVGSPTPAGKVCMAMRKAGLSGVNPGHPDLLALLEAGATEEEVLGAAQAAVDRGKPSFAYCLAMLKRQRQEAAAMASTLHRGALPRNLTAAEQRVLQAVPSLAAPHLRPVITTPLEALHAAPLALG